MSALAEIQTMIEERVSGEPALAGTFHDLYQRVVELRGTERQLRLDLQNLSEDYQNLFVQFSAQTGELARAKRRLAQLESPPLTCNPQGPLVPCVL